jgi:hypothetical protein
LNVYENKQPETAESQQKRDFGFNSWRQSGPGFPISSASNAVNTSAPPSRNSKSQYTPADLYENKRRKFAESWLIAENMA